ncbi:hypothetical protein IQ37_04640 [Chryseobacterium piperi]|uniref:MoxR-vWA-beta-propeller ternary system domain-containing protein n=1 Tax=Chryseobacterium piperi TaxID=558152 RepID=A0A086BL87_9FLAO|nr:hypothetical protein [Chryseobacterium piperi]ASW74664.1 hypothetical protein CJF12_10460 [Chryseobacterium piperi]KFF29701.1 hypothetical protein IQ37_04640 [Chryseobacterium piperi]
MAKDSSKCIVFWAELPRADEDFLGSIRDWKGGQIALDAETIWLKGFADEQADSSDLKQLPNFLLYELRDGLLFRRGALIPSKKVPTALLWSPIDKALRLTFPPSNQNFFGIHEKVKVKLKSSEEEQSAVALLCLVSDIKDRIAATPQFKLNKIDWIIINDYALFLGTPLLSFPGKAYWERDGHLLPAGFDFEFKNLSILLQQKYNPELKQWLLWTESGNYQPISKDDFRKLSVSSFRLTEKAKEWN